MPTCTCIPRSAAGSAQAAAGEHLVEVLERLQVAAGQGSRNGKDVLYSSLIPLIDCIKNGTTTIIDHHESQSFQTGSPSW